jgi:hypothetical protein
LAVEALRLLKEPGLMGLRPPMLTKIASELPPPKERRRDPNSRCKKPKRPGKARKPKLTKLKNEEKMPRPRPRKLKKKKGNSQVEATVVGIDDGDWLVQLDLRGDPGPRNLRRCASW